MRPRTKINLLQHPICFAEPKRLTRVSAWHQHIPFAMFLVDVLRPRILVELGTEYGDSYCAFCQAVRELNLSTRCYAVDTWQGDPHTGPYGPEVLADLRAHHDPLYGGFSRLVQSTFKDASKHFANGTIDLLHIDGYHVYEQVKEDFETWLPKVSRRGVILLHDTNVRELDFGVWRLWEQLKTKYPHFDFFHGHGLGLLAVGKVRNKKPQVLLNATPQEVNKIRQFFFDLGYRLDAKAKANVEVREREARIATLETTLAERDQAAQQFSQQVEALHSQVAERDQQATRLSEEVGNLETQFANLRQQAAEREARIATLETTVAEHEQALGAAQSQVQALEANRQRLEDSSQQLSDTVQGLGRLHGTLEAFEKYHLQLEAERTKERTEKQEERMELQKELRLAQRHSEDLELLLAQMQRSLGWRLLNLFYSRKERWLPAGSLLQRAYSAVHNYLERDQPEAGAPSLPVPKTAPSGSVPTPEELYRQWLRNARCTRPPWKEIKETLTNFHYRPLISIVMPVYNTPEVWLRHAIESVLRQWYACWELCICDDCSTEPHVRRVLEKYVAQDPRIRVVFAENNGGISRASNQALALASGEFVGLLDHDDELAPEALFEIVQLLQNTDADMIYSDEDKLDKRGRRCEPFFKPDWSPEYLLSCMYIPHFLVCRKELMDAVGRFRRAFEGSQDYDLVLRLVERTEHIFHIPKILYHWRKTVGSAAESPNAKPHSIEAGRRALEEHMQRRGIAAVVSHADLPNVYRVRPEIVSQPLVSIIVPTKANTEVWQRCLRSIETKTKYPNYEILIVDNSDSNVVSGLLPSSRRHKVILFSKPYNFSRMINSAARHAKGDFLLFFNDDTEVISADWLEALLEFAQLKEIGVVGAKLYYPDGSIQHAGVVLGIKGVAGHWQRGLNGHSRGYFNTLSVTRNCSAVTAACMMTRRNVFELVRGFDEKLAVAFNDVDFCLRVRERGFRIVWTPYAELHHHEHASRGYSVDPKEIDYMKDRWGAKLLNDPYYNPNLSLEHEYFALRF